MTHPRGVSILAALCGLALLAAAPRADVRASRKDAATLKQKVASINAHAERPTKAGQRIMVTENEVNSYLVFDAQSQLPTGVVDPSVTILGPGRLSGRAVVDLDAVRKAKNPTSLLDPMNYLMGRRAGDGDRRAEDRQRRRPLCSSNRRASAACRFRN